MMEATNPVHVFSQPTHEYPDPDSFSYITRYPWVGEDEGYMPSGLRSQPQNSRRNDSPNSLVESEKSWHAFNHDTYPLIRETSFDSDYQASDASIT